MIFVSYDFCLYHRGDFCPLFWRGSTYGNNIEDLNINNRYSRLWEPDYNNQFFKRTDDYSSLSVAIKDYDGSDNK